jgi:hypothetical protein
MSDILDTFDKEKHSAEAIEFKTPAGDHSPSGKYEYKSQLDIDPLDNHELSQRVTWKCDLRLVPILSLLYFTAFLDRINVANAKLEGFEKELHMPSNGYNTTLWIFIFRSSCSKYRSIFC